MKRTLFVAALLLSAGFFASYSETSDDPLILSNRALTEGNTEESIRALLQAVQSQQRTLEVLQARSVQQELALREQQEIVERLNRKVLEQEALILEQDEIIRRQADALAAGPVGPPQLLQAVESLDDIEKLYERAEATRTAGIFDAPRRDKEQYFRRAIVLFQQLAEIYPHSRRAPDAMFQAARISRRWLNDSQAAARYCQTIIERWPEDSFAEMARQELREIQGAGNP